MSQHNEIIWKSRKKLLNFLWYYPVVGFLPGVFDSRRKWENHYSFNWEHLNFELEAWERSIANPFQRIYTYYYALICYSIDKIHIVSFRASPDGRWTINVRLWYLRNKNRRTIPIHFYRGVEQSRGQFNCTADIPQGYPQYSSCERSSSRDLRCMRWWNFSMTFTFILIRTSNRIARNVETRSRVFFHSHAWLIITHWPSINDYFHSSMYIHNYPYKLS